MGKSRIRLINPLPKHFQEIQALCKKVYPFDRPWSIAQLESHRSYFPDGQLIAIDDETGAIVGLAFSLIISWNDYSAYDSWQDFTSGGFFHNHDPKKGQTLYGAEVMVDPSCRGQGIGKLLYEGRHKLAEKYNLKRIRAGARLRGYARHQKKLTPREYVIQVLSHELSDPTLSFQLSQNFKVINVASGYLYNDPESLGYAAVIEWLNPKACDKNDFDLQQNRIDSFLSGEHQPPEHLPKELRRLVRIATSALGDVIRSHEGDKFYKKIENYRHHLKKTRYENSKEKKIDSIFQKLSKENPSELLKITHAFSLQLELVNVCETAYRTWRLRQKAPQQGFNSKLNLFYVLTAHPTEARTAEVVATLKRIQNLLLEGIHEHFHFSDEGLRTLLRLLWLKSLAKAKKPSVIEEANYIYSLAFSRDIFDFLLQKKSNYKMRLRTWVGGDKDGHPCVDEVVMIRCLEGSRKILLCRLEEKLDLIGTDIRYLFETDIRWRLLLKKLNDFKSLLDVLKTIQKGDGSRIKVWLIKWRSFIKNSPTFIQDHEQTLMIGRLFDLFPALVLPIELREDAELIADALKDPTAAIRRMCVRLAQVSGALSPQNYAQGLIISHCESEVDIENACRLVEISFKRSAIPVVPLFETQQALINGKVIIATWLQKLKNQDRVARFWNRKLEVMLGYSDSAKELGALASRRLIAKAMQEIDRVICGFSLQPVFFHGSGGSVARGGGSLKEQISWWSGSALAVPKITLQGESIQRLFATKEILNSQNSLMTIEFLRRKVNRRKSKSHAILDHFSVQASQKYQTLISNSVLLETLLKASPYFYLDALKIGSRPSKRPSQDISVSKLRAIPWVLCWTQTRLLLPSWWGTGTAWANATDSEREELKILAKEDAFFSSFLKTLGFTLQKVDLVIWEKYLKELTSGIEPTELKKIVEEVRSEFLLTKQFFQEVTGEFRFLWHRPWLAESIVLRSSHIHILNAAQILAMKRKDEELIREATVGIACGMLTTG